MENIVEEVFKNTRMGIYSLDKMLDVTHNQKLAMELQDQKKRLEEINKEAFSMLDYDAVKRSDINLFEKGMVSGGIAIKTLSDNTDNKIASMLIEGNNMGLNSLQKHINALKDENKEVPRIADRLMGEYVHSIDTLRCYL